MSAQSASASQDPASAVNDLLTDLPSDTNVAVNATTLPEGPDNTGKKTTGIGDFIFSNPNEKKAPPLVPAGSKYRLEWFTQPKTLADPNNVTLEWRSGIWPDVSKWTVIASEVPNMGYFDWDIPQNLARDNYIVKISTKQKQPQIRDRVTTPIKIYQSRDPINGELVIPDSATNMVFSFTLAIIGSIFVQLIMAF